MPIHQAVIHQRIRNWAPFLVTECRFQDTRVCSEIVCRQASGGEKVEATLLFSVNIRKERARLHPGTAYTGTWHIFGKDNPQGVGRTTPKRSQGVKKSKIMTKSDLFKK